MGWAPRSSPALCAALALALGALPARAAELWMNPGTMGPNALPTEPGDTPLVPARTLLRLETAWQLGPGGDRAWVPAYRLEVPFGRRASFLSEGRPVELWRVGERTREAWGLGQGEGWAPGDLLFGAKFLAYAGTGRLPSVGLRVLTKSTTGKRLPARRFTNGPGYMLDALLRQPLGHVGTVALEAWALAGFFAWQQGLNGQNDASEWSATVLARFAGGSLVRADVRAYAGWQTFDKPLVAALGAEWAVAGHLALVATATLGFRDAPPLDVRIGLQLQLPAPVEE